MKHHSRMDSWNVVFAILAMATGVAYAQIAPPLYVGNEVRVTNALGRNLKGSWGVPDTACRVEIREVGSGILPPDPATGEGHPDNPLVKESYMGKTVIGVDPGKFSEVFTNRLEDGKTYFARVYDTPAAGDALYYANTTPFQDVPPAQRPTVPSITVAFQPLRLVSGEEDLDSDGDGIPDAMENEVLGTSPSLRDSDDDGWNDYYEAVNTDHLNPTEPNPIDLWMQAAEYGEDPPVMITPASVSWWTIPGLFYRLGYYEQAEDPDGFSEVWSGTATETNLVVDVEDVVVDPKGFFRVWAVP